MSSNAPKFTGFSFNAANVTPAAPLEPIPAGDYNVEMTDGEIVPTADGSGKRFKFELTVLDGEFKGRKIFDGFNIENKSAKAQEISHQQLSAMCHATGVIQFDDVQQLFGKPFVAKIGFVGATADKDDPSKTYDPKNTYKGARWDNKNAAPAGVPAGAPAWLKKPGAAPAPAASTPAPAKAAAPAKPAAAAPTKPKPAAAPAKPKVERKFFVFISDDEMPLKTEAEVAAMIAEGMPGDTQLSLADAEGGFVEGNGWKPASACEIGAAEAPTAATPAGAPVTPPWLKRK